MTCEQELLLLRLTVQIFILIISYWLYEEPDISFRAFTTIHVFEYFFETQSGCIIMLAIRWYWMKFEGR